MRAGVTRRETNRQSPFVATGTPDYLLQAGVLQVQIMGELQPAHTRTLRKSYQPGLTDRQEITVALIGNDCPGG
jgi:hypothetical protein